MELAVRLTQAGDRVRVYSVWSRPPKERSIIVDLLEANGIEIEFLQCDHVYQLLGARHRLIKSLIAFDPDVVQTFLFHANVIGTMAAKSAKVDVRIGGIRVAEPNPIRIPIERHAAKSMQHVVCVSSEVAKFAEKYLNLDPIKTSTIPNGVDVTRFATATAFDWTKLGWDSDRLVTLFVGRMHPQKNLDLIQAKIDSLAPKDSQRSVLLVGDGPLATSIDQWVRTVGEDRVRRLSFQNDIAPLIKAARLLILPSHYEGMPNVVLEAMASGRPVVCSDVEGSRELLAHASDTQCFDRDDGDQMARLAEQFLTDAAFADEIGLQNQAFVRNQFSLPAMVDAYRTLYRDLTIANPGQSH